ncbi:MAG: DNA-protecting protein DprA [Candidatus Omnitrophica bacterium]|nr:DNA-protecting protein DprA [Candidatus Omnitrophota bacterium]
MTYSQSSTSPVSFSVPGESVPSLLPSRVERDSLIVLNAISGFGNRRTIKLIEHYGSAQGVLERLGGDISLFTDVPEAAVFNFKNFDKEEFMAREMAHLKEHDARIVTFLDKDYPPALRNIHDYPLVLYVCGDWPENMDCSVAVVGSRKPTFYGLETAEKFSRALAELGVVVVSGLARGIDAAAHRGCLKANGQTIAVLGCGLDYIYPEENRELYELIKTQGCLMSEFPFGTKPITYNFPRRNRIVSGVSLGVLVVEANIKSGALITAGFALEQGKEVFAVPGRIDSTLSSGPLALIKQGAKVALSVEDLLEELPLRLRGNSVLSQQPELFPMDKEAGLSAEEKRVLHIIKEGKLLTLEEIELKTGLAPSSLMGPLLLLEIKRLIRQQPGKVYEVA